MNILCQCVHAPIKVMHPTLVCQLVSRNNLRSLSRSHLLKVAVDFKLLRTSVLTLQVRTYAQVKPRDKGQTGKELDIKRQNPYAGLSAGQKGSVQSQIFN